MSTARQLPVALDPARATWRVAWRDRGELTAVGAMILLLGGMLPLALLVVAASIAETSFMAVSLLAPLLVAAAWWLYERRRPDTAAEAERAARQR